ncbi:MAG: hypothetical protein JNM99_05605 [Verrucomicrobiaceae bacterium]|nr:hypothetical protein [Verrucomicrobiaceae bacterium]
MADYAPGLNLDNVVTLAAFQSYGHQWLLVLRRRWCFHWWLWLRGIELEQVLAPVSLSYQKPARSSTRTVDLEPRRVDVLNLYLSSFVSNDFPIFGAMRCTAFAHEKPAQFIVEIGLSRLFALLL